MLHFVAVQRITRVALLAFLLAGGALPVQAYDWPQFNGDPAHTGSNTRETALGVGNVGALRQVFQTTLPGNADGSPAYLAGVSTAGGTKDLVFLTTTNGQIIARDAYTGASVWAKQFGPTNPDGSPCIINGIPPVASGTACYTTSSPAVDPNGQFVYTYGLDGKAHKLAVGTGAEVTSGGWPEVTTLKPWQEKGSSALAIATAQSGASYLYIANAGYPGDSGDYQGHITTINLADGSQRVFNAACSDQTTHFVQSPGTPDCAGKRNAVWARPGVVYDADTNRVYFSTGNGMFDAVHTWDDSVLAINPDGTGNGGGPLDSYTPTNRDQLNTADADLGSAAPALLPPVANSAIPHLGVQSGKDGKLRLLNLDSLGFGRAANHLGGEIGAIIDVPQNVGGASYGGVHTQPVVWTNPADGTAWVFVANPNGIAGLQVVVDGSGNPSLVTKWRQQGVGSESSPIVANGAVYFARSNSLRAFNATTGAQLWQTTGIGAIHWAAPVVANGVLYLSDGASHLTAFAAPPTVSGLSPATVQTAGGMVTVSGSGFTPGTTVTVDGVPATNVVVTSGTQLTFTAPARGPGTTAVVVIRTPVGLSATTGLGYQGRVAAPTVAGGVNPAPPPRPAAPPANPAAPLPPRRTG